MLIDPANLAKQSCPQVNAAHCRLKFTHPNQLAFTMSQTLAVTMQTNSLTSYRDQTWVGVQKMNAYVQNHPPLPHEKKMRPWHLG